MTKPSRRRPGARPLKRRVAIRKPRKTLLIFCEGEQTEPDYLDALKRQPSVREKAAVDLRVERGHGGSVPLTLVEMARTAQRKAEEEEGEIDEVWCVFDVEWPRNHPGLLEAVQQASQAGINLAVSNPCFEIWLILHFQDQSAWLDNDDARHLRKRLDGSTAKEIEPARYMSSYEEAARRAFELDQRHEGNGTSFPHNNPSTGMHHLIAAVRPENMS